LFCYECVWYWDERDWNAYLDEGPMGFMRISPLSSIIVFASVSPSFAAHLLLWIIYKLHITPEITHWSLSVVTAFSGYNESYPFKCSSHHHPCQWTLDSMPPMRWICHRLGLKLASVDTYSWYHRLILSTSAAVWSRRNGFHVLWKGPKNGRNRCKYSCGMLSKPQYCCWTAFNLHYCSWYPFTGSINLPLIMLHYLTESCLEYWYFLHAIWWLGSIAGWAQKSPGKPPTAKALSGCNACTSSSGSSNIFTDHTRMSPRGARCISVSIPVAANTMSSKPDHQICTQHIWALPTVLCDTIPWSWSWQTYYIK